MGDELLHEARRGNGGNAGGIIRGRDLHHIIAHDIQICQTAHQLQGLGGGEAAGYGRTGSRRIGGIQEVDVEGQEGLGAAHPRADGLQNGLHAHLVALVGAQHLVAQIGGVGQILRAVQPLADAHLDGFGGVHQPLLRRVIEGGAVVVRLAEVLVNGVVVGVKVDQRHRAVYLGAGPQLGQGDAVVAAHGHWHNPLLKEGQHSLCDELKGLLDIAGHRPQIAVIHTGAPVKNTHIQRAVKGLGRQGGGVADRGRPQARAHPEGGAGVVGDADHGKVDVVGGDHVLHTHEGLYTGKPGRLQGILCFVLNHSPLLLLQLRSCEARRERPPRGNWTAAPVPLGGALLRPSSPCMPHSIPLCYTKVNPCFSFL